MPRYKIPVTRVGYACRTIDVQADDLPQAQRLTLDSAGDHRFSEHEAEYRLAEEFAATAPSGGQPDGPCMHLSSMKQERIRRLAIDRLAGNILGDRDNPRFWAGQIVNGWGLDQCLEQISGGPDELLEVLGFDPHTGKETPP